MTSDLFFFFVLHLTGVKRFARHSFYKKKRDSSFTPSKMQGQSGPQVILLKEGTDTSQGRGQLLGNISACMTVADVVRTTLGPRGMDKLMVDSKGKVTGFSYSLGYHFKRWRDNPKVA
jgi:hypothetical protein